MEFRGANINPYLEVDAEKEFGIPQFLEKSAEYPHEKHTKQPPDD